MIKTHEETVSKQIEVLDDIICNCCGNSIKKNPYVDNYHYDYVTISTNWGYFSEIFGDGERHNFEICEKCYAKWLSTFKIAPKGFGESSFHRDYEGKSVTEQEDFEEWKKQFK